MEKAAEGLHDSLDVEAEGKEGLQQVSCYRVVGETAVLDLGERREG